VSPPARRAAGPLLAAAAVLAGCGTSHSPAPAPAAATPPPAPPAAAAAAPFVEGPVDPPAIAAPAPAAARAFVVILNTHDGRPGGDTGLHGANRRARSLVTPALYAALRDPPTRSAGREWARLAAAHASTAVTAVTVTITHRRGDPRPHQLAVEVAYTVEQGPVTGRLALPRLS